MKSVRPSIKATATVVLSLLFAAWLTHVLADVGWGFFSPLLTLPSWLLWFAFLGLLSTYALRGWRVAFEFQDHPKATLLTSIQIVLWHNASVNALPFRSGELAFPLLLKRLAQVPLLHATASLIHLRIQDATVVVLLGLLVWPGLDPAVRIALISAAVLCGWGFFKWLRQAHHWHDATHKVKKHLAAMRDAMARANPSAHWSWLLTLCNWLIKVSVQAALYVHLVGIEFGSGVLAAMGSELAAFSPLQGIAGVGTFEVSSALAMYADGIAWQDGVQAAAQVHLIMLTSAFFWAGVAWLISYFTKEKVT